MTIIIIIGQCEISSNMIKKWTPFVNENKGVINWSMESNKICGQIGQNTYTSSQEFKNKFSQLIHGVK
jgi:hypothetical protein